MFIKRLAHNEKFKNKIFDKYLEKHFVDHKFSEDKTVNFVIALTTFSRKIRNTVREINALAKTECQSYTCFQDGHKAGFKQVNDKKAVDMAKNYLDILSRNYLRRIRGLKGIKAESENYESNEMPKNTKRVIAALIKETVKEARKDKPNILKQYRLIAQFQEALSGRGAVIRRLLNELRLPEISEKDNEMSFVGWDDLVYDNLSSGRKTPSQVLVDAAGKCLQEITLVYDDFDRPRLLAEAMTGGEILDVRVIPGLEIMVRNNGDHFHQVILFENLKRPEDVQALLKDQAFQEFRKGISKNIETQQNVLRELIFDFNGLPLQKINQQLLKGLPLLPAISIKDIQEYAQGRQIQHVHLGRFLYKVLKEHLLAEAQRHPANAQKVEKVLNSINPVYLRKEYFDQTYFTILKEANLMTDQKVADLLAKVKLVNSQGEPIIPRLVFTRPLLHGLAAAVKFLLLNHQNIQAVEIWNNRITTPGYREDTLKLNQIRNYLNIGAKEKLIKYLKDNDIIIDSKLITAAIEHYAEEPLYARFGSNSDGYNRLVPGMGLGIKEKVLNWLRLKMLNNVEELPFIVRNYDQTRKFLGLAHVENAAFNGNILQLGKRVNYKQQILQQEENGKQYSVRKEYFRDLNKDIKNVFKLAAGFCFSMGFDILNAAIFKQYVPFGFGVFVFWAIWTYQRNFFVDLIAKGGWKPRNWHLRHFDRNNAANSVFFSFGSIPILKLWELFLKVKVLAWADPSIDKLALRLTVISHEYFYFLESLFKPTSNFFEELIGRFIVFINIATLNGLFIFGHTTLRGFTFEVRKRNLGRSLIAGPIGLFISFFLPSIPFAVSLGVFSFLMTTVILNKLVSDGVGAVIEGNGKAKREFKRTIKIFSEIIPNLRTTGNYLQARLKRIKAVLDMMYVWRYEGMARTALRRIFKQLQLNAEDLNNILQIVQSKETEKVLVGDFGEEARVLLKKFNAMKTDFSIFILQRIKKVLKKTN